jgi:hypothetical protein
MAMMITSSSLLVLTMVTTVAQALAATLGNTLMMTVMILNCVHPTNLSTGISHAASSQILAQISHSPQTGSYLVPYGERPINLHIVLMASLCCESLSFLRLMVVFVANSLFFVYSCSFRVQLAVYPL